MTPAKDIKWTPRVVNHSSLPQKKKKERRRMVF